MNNTEIFDKDLNPVLESASNADLDVLVGYIKEKFSEDLTYSEAYKKYSPEHEMYADLIAKELREMGGHAFIGLFRSEGPPYYEIVCDVADKVGAPYRKGRDIENIEDSILETVLHKALDDMTYEEKQNLVDELGEDVDLKAGGISTAILIGLFRAGGFYSYQLTVIIANAIAKALLGKGLLFATNQGLVKVASLATGPIGLAISALWTMVDLGSPAYSVTIPSVIHIAMLRKKLNSITCNNCKSFIADTTAKFCSNCGTAIPLKL